MLGYEVYHYFTVKGHTVLATDINLTDTWVKSQDVRDYASLLTSILEFAPDIIMNLAAITDLEECELHPDEAVTTNAIGSANCATIADLLNIKYVYISTAGIFDGKQEFYTDDDIPNPLGYYARSKYMGEKFAQATKKHIVLRCGWQMGSGHLDKKFINKIWKQIKNGATELNVVTDKEGTPTYVKDFTMQIEKLIETNSYGVWNSVCKGNATRYDVAVEFLRLMNLTNKIKIKVVSSEFFAKEYFAPRPASEKLITTKLDAAGLNVMRPWQEALAEYIETYSSYFNSDGK